MDTSHHYVRNGIIGTVAVGIGMLIPLIFSFAQKEAYAQIASSTPACTVTVTPSSIVAGDPATLSWTSTSSTAVFFNQGIGTTTAAASGSLTVHPTSTLSYIGAFSGDGGTTTCTAILAVSPAVTTTNLTDITGTTTSNPTVIATPIIATTTTPVASLTPAIYPLAGTTIAPMVINIDASNNATVRGTVQSVNPNLMVINSWGGMWIIRFNGVSTITPVPIDGTNTFSSIRVGDFVGIQGTIAQDQFYTVDAAYVRDWTTSPSTTTVTPSDTTSSPSGTVALYTGTVSSIGDTSFVITDATAGITYTVNTAADTTLWNNTRQFIGFSDIRSGDTVRINGDLGPDNTINATVVRDTSL